MKQGIITAVDLVRLLDEAAADFTVYAPVEQEGGAAFEKRGVGAAPLLDFANAKLSPKGIFFPQTEVYRYGLRVKPVPTNRRSSVRVTTMAVNILTNTPMASVRAKPITGALATMELPSQ